MKNKYLIFLIILFSNITYGQDCTSNNEFGSYTADNSGFLEEVTTFFSPGDYHTVDNIIDNEYNFYGFHSALGEPVNDYIVLTNSSNTILHQGISPINYTFTNGELSDGTIRLHIFLDATCDTDDINITVELLNLTVEPSTCQLPENPRVSYRSDTRIDFYWDAPSLGSIPASYDWEAVPSGNPQGVGVVDSGNTTTPDASATGLNSNTFYSFYIRSTCGANGSSDWFETPPLRTNIGPPPTNDLCSGATEVIQDTNADVDSATIINGNLVNTAGTDIPAEQCSGSSVDNARDDVWYSFVAYTTNVNIRLTSNYNGILTLFSDCNSSAIIDCSDSSGPGGSNQIEEISYNNFVVGQTYYVRVYYQGFAIGSSAFTLKIWSSMSAPDSDGDGFNSIVDCNDNDSNINPGAQEICDGIDNDCDGLIDDQDDSITNQTTWYIDTDNDSYGNPSISLNACTQPLGYVLDNSDCDDNNADINPNSDEICDNIDNNCNLQTDEGFDQDGDGVADCLDNCPNNSNAGQEDSDSDGVGDACDTCPNDPNNDADNDGVCDDIDNCVGTANADQADTDGDGIGDLCDDCIDNDSDGVCDDVDNCVGVSNPLQEDCDNNGIGDACDNDTDGDGVSDGCDVCPGFNDTIDTDSDGVPDGCDVCPGLDDTTDIDNDTVPDGCDICPDSDDNVDTDVDGVPDGCDVCPGLDDNIDTDGDGVPDGCDVCSGSDDNIDSDGDSIPDGCDICPGSDDNADTDGDGVPNGCDACPGTNDTIDSDGDGIPDGCDVCPGSNDNVDSDGDGVPNGCDSCPGSDDTVDTDFDGVADGCDTCPGFDDNLDSDGDDIPDGCDSEECDGVDNDGDGQIDEGFDTDNDGFTVCNGDCDDSDDSIYPGATEVANDGIDQDCDGSDLIIGPDNDNLCDAQNLLVGNSTSGGTYTNINATVESSEPSGVCWTAGDLATSSVWFSFVSPSSGEVIITTDFNDGTLTNTQLTLYSIADCNNMTTLTPLICNDDISGSNTLSYIEVTGLTGGNTYYIQVDGFNNEEGTFDIGISEPTLSSQAIQDSELFKFYPNPVKENLTIKSTNSVYQVFVYNIIGEEVVNMNNVNSYEINIDFDLFNSGIYLIKVHTDKGVGIVRVVKE